MHSLARLSDSTCADSSNISLTIEDKGSRKNKKNKEKKYCEFKDKVASSFHELVRSQSLKQHYELKKDLREMKSKHKDLSDEDEKADLMQHIEENEEICKSTKKNLGV